MFVSSRAGDEELQQVALSLDVVVVLAVEVVEQIVLLLDAEAEGVEVPRQG